MLHGVLHIDMLHGMLHIACTYMTKSSIAFKDLR